MAMIIGMMMAAAGVALLAKMLKGGIFSPMSSTKKSGASRDLIIETDDYRIVDEIQDQ